MPQHNMESTRSPWQQGLRPPWMTRLAGVQSPASSGAESDTESSTESERSCIRKLEGGSLRYLPSPCMLQRRITEIDQQKEELKIELQLEIALLQGELQTEQSQLRRHTQKLRALQQEARQKDRQKERESLEEERLRLEGLKGRHDEKEKLISSQPEGQREQLMLQQEREAMEAAMRAFEDWEFRFLEQESGLDEEDADKKNEGGESGADVEKEMSCQQHAINTVQERVQQFQSQLKELQREKERELNALREERRDLVHTNQTVLKEKKPLADWSNITGSAPCMMSLSPLTIHKPPQEPYKASASLPRRRSSHRSSRVSDRPVSAHGLARTLPDTQSPEAFSSPPIASRRLSNGHAVAHRHVNGFLTPCNSTTSSRAASPSLLDLVEIEKKLREAKAERERLLREREERRWWLLEERKQKERNSPVLEPEGQEAPQRLELALEPEEQPQASSPPNSPEKALQPHGLPLFLSPNFDLRAHVESLGHGVSGCVDLRLTPRRCAGFLTKRGGRVKTWKKRWFLFDMDHKRLAYYTDCDERKLKGVIYFQAIEEVYLDHLRTATSSPRPSLTFCVKTYDRLFFMVATNPVAMRIWMDVVVTATDEHSRY
ncbi:pleckstrin homology-like domain family B member 3 isoform 1-T2 [Spinachia spinachia]